MSEIEEVLSNKTITNEKVEIVRDYFDFDSIDEDRVIPKYKDILADLELGKSKFSHRFLSQFGQYEGGLDIPELLEYSVYSGHVVQIKDREVIINIGNKDNVIIDRRGSEESICKQLKIGQPVDVLITKIQENPFLIKGSVADLVRIRVDNKMKDFFENKTAIEAFVKEIIPAGYLLNIDIDNITIDAFMPNTLADVNKLHDVDVLLGQKVFVMLETLQQDKGIYVVSRKKFLKTLIPEKIKELKKYPRDHVFTGHVTGTRSFGIFIQFEDCLTGMIHKANIREDYQDKLETIQPGTIIDFYIKDIIKGGAQIILTQILKESLWETIRVGDTLKGKVFSVKPFGALIELDYETNGLIQTTYLNKNSRKLEEGSEVDVVVISIIRDDRKIYLTFADDSEMVSKLKDKSDEMDKLKQKFNSK
jgi:small subunit ribosomal protein S1